MRPDINAIEERRKRLYKSDADNVYVEDYLADTEFLLNRINDLTTQLAEVKADYESAVEDMKIACTVGEPCFICKHGCNRGDQFPCSVSDDWCKGEKWTYRGRKSNGR